MFQWLRTWQHRRIVSKAPFSEQDWHDAFHGLTILDRLQVDEKTKLKELAILFLHYKSLEVVDDLELTTAMQLNIALQACLLILNLGLNWYAGWHSVIIYPGAFTKKSVVIDEFGIQHEGQVNLSGESWQQGPVILSWDDALHHGERNRENVIIHEFAHKLDSLNGRANGFPPLHADMSAPQWSKVFNHAYQDLVLHQEKHQPIPINAYAATSPAEFFAVFSEYFFEKPEILIHYYPEVYELLSQFYRQVTMHSNEES